MKLPPLEYACPASLAEAVALLASGGGDARAIAGGQSLMPMLAFRVVAPSLLVDLRKLPELQARSRSAPTACGSAPWCAGATSRTTRGLRRAHPLLKAAVAHVAHYQIRNRGTVGGSIAHADPAAEMPGIAVDLRRRDRRHRPKGGAHDHAPTTSSSGALTTALEPDEIITEIRLPAWPAKRRWGFQEFARRRGDFAMAAAALFYDQDAAGKAINAHVGVIGLGDRPRRLPEVEAVLNGSAVDEAVDGARRRGHVGDGRAAGRHPRQRRLSPVARRHHGRARAAKRRRTDNRVRRSCPPTSKSTASRSASTSSRA